MKHDAGLAPSPFGGTCTLAVCTPNHQGSRAKARDWIAGVSDKQRGYKLIHVREVDERIHMSDYFKDERFAVKKPILNGTAQQRCGDNFYSLDAVARWTQHRTTITQAPLALHKIRGIPGSSWLDASGTSDARRSICLRHHADVWWPGRTAMFSMRRWSASGISSIKASSYPSSSRRSMMCSATARS